MTTIRCKTRWVNYCRIAFILALLLVLCGCDAFEKLRSSAREEERVVGPVDGYNPQIKAIERSLKVRGFDPGEIDGRMDKKLRLAIKEFQKKQGLPETGSIDKQTRSLLEFPVRAKAGVARPKTAESVSAANGPAQVRLAQEALKNAGFDPGPADGVIGAKTRTALKSFQKAKNLKADGRLSESTWQELMKLVPQQ